MKIFALATFTLCLICALTLQVESFEEGKPKRFKKSKGFSGFTKACSSIKVDKKNNLSAKCKTGKKSATVKISLAKCAKTKAIIKGAKCSLKKSKFTCTIKKAKKSVDLNKIIGFSKGKLSC